MPKLRFLAMLLSITIFSQLSVAEEAHKHHHDGQTRLSLNNGVKWQTDAPLRENMETLRMAFKQQLNAIHSDTLDEKEYIKLAALTEQIVNNIIKECELPPNADAQLHIIVAQMLTGAAQIKAKDNEPSFKQSAHQIAVALINYGEYFNHEGWQGLK
ncbi:hypothetical protein [Thalassotalea ganghwensis]